MINVHFNKTTEDANILQYSGLGVRVFLDVSQIFFPPGLDEYR